MLGPQRQIFAKILGMASQRAGERGGLLSYVASSGVTVIGYLDTITTGTIPLGIQLHDVEHIDEGYQFNPMYRGHREVNKIGESLAFSPHCIVDTNFIHPNAQPHSGKKAYLAPSGLITDDPSLNGYCVGHFMSSLNDPDVAGLPTTSDVITIKGGGFVRGSYMKKVSRGKFEIQEESIENVTLTSPGWARVRIKL
jgi:hypothetical protein